MAKKKSISVPESQPSGSILSFFGATPPAKPKKTKEVKRKVAQQPVTGSSASAVPASVVIDLCSESDAKPLAKRAKEDLDCSPPPAAAVDDKGEGCSKTAYREPEDVWLVPSDDEEVPIAGNGLEGALNPDYQDENELCEQVSRQADEGDAESDCDSTISRRSMSVDQQRSVSATPQRKSLSAMSFGFVESAFQKKGKGKGKAKENEMLAPTAFTALMSGHKEDKAWKEAAISERTKRVRGDMRAAPFYKIMEGMPLAVDAFRYGKIPGIRAYFLSHAHSDHYTNLSGSWCHGPVYCSKTTANLIIMNLGVKPQWVKPLPYDQTVVVEGVNVTMLDANHCPGSSLFLFEGPQTAASSPYAKTPSRIFRYLHCGDFRASPRHLLHPAMVGKKIDICYLDTTYCAPSHQFPAQEQVISACAQLICDRIQGDESALRRGLGSAKSTIKSEELFKGWLGNKKEEDDDGHLCLTAKDEKEMNCDVADVESEEEKEKPELDALTLDEAEPDEAMPDAELEDASKAEAKEEEETSLLAEEVKTTKEEEVDEKKPRTKEHFLVLVGTYSIGKERIVKAIAKAIGSKIYCSDHKMKLMECIDEDPELRSMLTRDPLQAQVHVTGLFAIKRDTLGEYLDSFKGHFTKIIGLRPTGWTFKADGVKEKSPSVAKTITNQTHKNYSPAFLYPQRDSTERLMAFGVPYSEHSSFRELTCFCVSMDHVRIIATVNVTSETSRAKMKSWFEKWQAERKRRRDNGEPAMVPYRTIDYW